MCELTDMVCEYEALDRLNRGEQPSFSMGICGQVTCGYGECDQYGYWQFPLYPAEDYLNKVVKRSREGQ